VTGFDAKAENGGDFGRERLDRKGASQDQHEDKTKIEAVRCIKHHVARDVFALLPEVAAG
jgi:hypothetical protein